MLLKKEEKIKAINLRKKGHSYSEILQEIPVAKSTLSLWLRSVGLSKRQKQRLTRKKLAAAKKGGEARRDYRIATTREIKEKAVRDIGKISKRDLWLIGVALYWAEGQKEREKASSVKFGNSDPEMIKLFLKWLNNICGITEQDISFRIYFHENSKNRADEVRKYWSEVTGFPEECFQKITWKKNKIKTTNRKNTGRDYYGLLQVEVKRSTNLNRKIQGWIEGTCRCRVV